MMRARSGQGPSVGYEVVQPGQQTPRHRLVIVLTPREREDLELLQGRNHFTAEEFDRPHGGLV
jgi:hypothetical protein